MSTELHAPYLFVIDTADYAGNFERELCAYVTGRIGDCEVGREMAALFEEEIGQEPFKNVTCEPDDHGCSRPATIYPTPGWFNHGQGGHFRDGDEAAALLDYRKAVRKFAMEDCYHVYLKDWRANPDSRERYQKSGWTEAKLEKACRDSEKEIEKADALKKVRKWPAYLSVAISFETEPTASQIALMKERADQFAALPAETYGGPPRGQRISQITSFRLIKQTKQAEETTL